MYLSLPGMRAIERLLGVIYYNHRKIICEGILKNERRQTL